MDQLTSLPPLVAVLAVSGAVVAGAMTLKVRRKIGVASPASNETT